MKYVAFLAVLFLSVNLSQQLPKLVNCASDFVPPSSVANSCMVITCVGSGFGAVGCGRSQCPPDKYLGRIASDNSKPYPECCGGPICKD